MSSKSRDASASHHIKMAVHFELMAKIIPSMSDKYIGFAQKRRELALKYLKTQYRKAVHRTTGASKMEDQNEMNFGGAIEALKAGKRVSRAGWNGKGMFLYYVPANKYPASGNTFGTMKGEFPDDLVPYGAYIAMKTAQNNVVPWLASQSDMLAEDWATE